MEITIKHIERIVCKERRVGIDEIHIKCRKDKYRIPRQTIIYFARELVKVDKKPITFAKIGAYFGRDHSTAISSCKAIQNMYDTNKSFKTEIDDLRVKINEKPNLLVMAKKLLTESERMRTEIEKMRTEIENLQGTSEKITTGQFEDDELIKKLGI